LDWTQRNLQYRGADAASADKSHLFTAKLQSGAE
jgi:hypothetical protein